MATVIPVKVLNQNGSGWSSVIARGIVYVADLKAGPLAASPVVINMSLGGGALDPSKRPPSTTPLPRASSSWPRRGMRANGGMGYPGAYAPVISVAASGYLGEWYPAAGGAWWYRMNVSDPTKPAEFYITDFSSREKPGQDLDVAAPGSWVLRPVPDEQRPDLSYYFLGGTSMASPHVAGDRRADGAEVPSADRRSGRDDSRCVSHLSRTRLSQCHGPDGTIAQYCWGADATGAGLATADAALAGVQALTSPTPKKKK